MFQVFSQMLHVGVSLEFEVVQEVLEATVVELERNHLKLKCPGPKGDVEAIKVSIIIIFIFLNEYKQLKVESNQSILRIAFWA